MPSPINEYNKRINTIRSEIRNLKTAHFKTATKISTIEKTYNINFSLYLDTLTGEMYGDKRAIITLTTEDNSEMISACYVDGIDPAFVANNRFLAVHKITSDPGEVKYEIIVISQNPNDFNTLWGGGSVNLNYTIRLVGSSQFNISVEYRNYLGGSS